MHICVHLCVSKGGGGVRVCVCVCKHSCVYVCKCERRHGWAGRKEGWLVLTVL